MTQGDGPFTMKLSLLIDTRMAPDSTLQFSACSVCQLGPADHFEPAGTAMLMSSDSVRERRAIPGRGKVKVEI